MSPTDVISNPASTDAALVESLRGLEGTTVPAEFWREIAASPRFTDLHRQRCAYEFFHRHFTPGSTLREAFGLLGDPDWIDQRDVKVVRWLTGKCHVEVSIRYDTFEVSFLPGGGTDSGFVHISVDGEFEDDEYRDLLRLRPVRQEVGDAKVLQVGTRGRCTGRPPPRRNV